MRSLITIENHDIFSKTEVTFVADKIDGNKELTLRKLFNKYYYAIVAHSSKNTSRAKLSDLFNFLEFYEKQFGSDIIDYWVPSTSRTYRNYLEQNLKLKPTSINRKLATLRHAANWIEARHPFPWGSPFQGIKDIEMNAIAWKGLNSKEISRLKAACDRRMAYCTKKNQNPLLETTIFYILLHTGLREMELCNLNIYQYKKDEGFINVKRKGNKVSGFVPLSKEAIELLNKYLSTRDPTNLDDPLFLNIKKNRLRTKDVYYACNQIKMEANKKLSDDEKIIFTPHSLRHVFLKKIADKLGIHVAFEMSGNVSMTEIYRYTRPSIEEMQNIVTECFE